MSATPIIGGIKLQERRELSGLYLVQKAVRCLGLKRGDAISIELGKADPFVVHRALDCDLLTLSDAIFNTRAIVSLEPVDQVVVNRGQLDEPESGRRRLKLVRGGVR